MNRRKFAILSACAVGLGPLGCQRSISNNEAAATEPVKLTLSVAASLQDAMQAVQAVYRAAAAEVEMVDNFGASGSLSQQIMQGAPVDVFWSASPGWMDALDKEGLLVEGSRKDLLRNSLVLVVPQDSDLVSGFENLEAKKVKRIAMGEPEGVPAGKYAKECLEKRELFEGLRSKLVYGKDVRQVLSYVEMGSVEAGLVYKTDALASDKVRVVATVSQGEHSPILYPVAAVKSSGQVARSRAFLDFLSTEAAMVVFQERGFDVVG